MSSTDTWPEWDFIGKFGADPTGQKDCFPAFSAFVTACNQQGGGILVVPHGTFKFKTTATLVPTFSMLIRGSSSASIIKIALPGTSDILFDFQATGNPKLLSVFDLSFTGRVSSQQVLSCTGTGTFNTVVVERCASPDTSWATPASFTTGSSTVHTDFDDNAFPTDTVYSLTGGSGSGSVSGSGTAGKLSKWSTSTILTDSIATEASTTITVAGTLAATAVNAPAFDRATAGDLAVGGTAATTVTIGDAIVNTTVYLGSNTGGSTVILNNGAMDCLSGNSMSIGTANAINIYTGNVIGGGCHWYHTGFLGASVSILSPIFDRATSGVLSIGTTAATSIASGSGTITWTHTGTLTATISLTTATLGATTRVQTPQLDTASAGALSVGNSNATSIASGSGTITWTHTGTISATVKVVSPIHDVASAGALSIGTATATSIASGSGTITWTHTGTISATVKVVSPIHDVASAGALSIGTATATSINYGSGTITHTMTGVFAVTGANAISTFSGTIAGNHSLNLRNLSSTGFSSMSVTDSASAGQGGGIGWGNSGVDSRYASKVWIATTTSWSFIGASDTVYLTIGNTGALSITNTCDLLAAGTLTIGGTVATAVQVGRAGQSLGFYGVTVTTQQAVSTTLTNNVTVGGTTNTVDNVVAASVDTSAADLVTTRNAIYQLTLKLRTMEAALKLVGIIKT
jgi:hypothetical protein